MEGVQESVRLVTTRAWALVALVVALIIGVVCWSEGGRHAALKQYHVERQTITDTIRVVDQRLRVDTVRVREHSAAAVVARVTFDSAARVVEAVADTSSVVPVSMVLPAIATCRSALDADSVLVADLRASLTDALAKATLEAKRADLAENALKHATPRVGFKTGAIVVGALWVASHFLPARK